MNNKTDVGPDIVSLPPSGTRFWTRLLWPVASQQVWCILDFLLGQKQKPPGFPGKPSYIIIRYFLVLHQKKKERKKQSDQPALKAVSTLLVNEEYCLMLSLSVNGLSDYYTIFSNLTLPCFLCYRIEV